jgi:FlaA1/EpsC-like NDP-sugar epimerase
MGASKRLVEWLVKDAATGEGEERTFVRLRFGNVLGSRGSMIPVFRAQIEAGDPVTVTAAPMTRSFVTIPEAVLFAGAE